MHSRTRGVLLSPLALELGRGQVPQRRVNPLAIVDVVKESSQAPQRVAEVLVLREVDLLLLDRPDIRDHSVYAFSAAPLGVPHPGAPSVLSTSMGPFGPGS